MTKTIGDLNVKGELSMDLVIIKITFLLVNFTPVHQFPMILVTYLLSCTHLGEYLMTLPVYYSVDGATFELHHITSQCSCLV